MRGLSNLRGLSTSRGLSTLCELSTLRGLSILNQGLATCEKYVKGESLMLEGVLGVDGESALNRARGEVLEGAMFHDLRELRKLSVVG